MALLVGICLTACTDYREDMYINPEGESYLQLRLVFGHTTRAAVSPEGDEDGDGREDAHFNENSIFNVCFFIYNDVGKFFNAADAATTFKYTGYIGGLNLTGATDYTTAPIKIKSYRPAAGDRIIVLANVGDLSKTYTTIGALRTAEIIRANTWSASTKIKDYSMFAMSSCTDDATYGKVDNTKAGSEADPFLATAEIERIAARIDWQLPLDGSGNPDLSADGAKYSVSEAGTAGTMYITDIRVVNDAVSNTYLIRRSAPTVDGAVTYMAKQTVDAKNHPTAYVITPTTIAKKTAVTYDTWFDASTFANSKNAATFFPAGTTYNVYANAGSTPDRFLVGTTDWCYTIGYTMENTMDVTKQNNNLRTGLLLKSVFVPTTVYACATVGDLPTATTYTKGEDFWYYEDRLDRTKSMFFKTETDFDNYANGKSSYEKHHYVGGVCYYYIWIKHAGGNEELALDGTYPMEYAIVRNNIYRIKVETVLSVGTPTPESTKERIRVRQWNKRTHAEILL